MYTNTHTHKKKVSSPHFFTKLHVEILQSPWSVLHSPGSCLEDNSLAKHLHLLHLHDHMFLAPSSRKLFSLISIGENPPCSLCLNFVPRDTYKQTCCRFLFISFISREEQAPVTELTTNVGLLYAVLPERSFKTTVTQPKI